MIDEQSTSRWLDLPGHGRLHYHEAGTGRAVVVLHGGGPGATAWNRFGRHVDHYAKRYRIVLPDMPGYGRSDEPPEGQAWGPGGWAPVVSALFDALGIERADVIAHANGSNGALRLALDFPDRVGKLVLTGVHILSPAHTTGPRNPSLGALTRLRAELSADAVREYLETLFWDPKLVTDELVEERLDALRLNQELGGKPGRPADSGMLTVEALEGVAAPLLIVAGANDLHVPEGATRAFMEHVPDAELHVFSRCGHWVDHERADDFDRVVMDFLER